MRFSSHICFVLQLALHTYPLLAQRRFEAKDGLLLTDLDDLVVSPSGRRAAYSRADFDNATKSRPKWLWLIDDIDSNTSRKLFEFKEPPQFSWAPDESMYCWTRAMEGLAKPQLQCSASDKDGPPNTLTNFDDGVSAYIWSPDSKQLAILTKVSPSFETLPNVHVFTNAVYAFGLGTDYAKYYKAAQIWTISLEEGQSRKPSLLASLNTTSNLVAWSADNSALLFTVENAAETYYGNGTLELRTVRVSDKKQLSSRPMSRAEISRVLGTGGLQPNPKGTKLAVLKPDPDAPPEFAQMDVHVIDSATWTSQNFTQDHDFDIQNIAWGGDDILFAFSFEKGDTALIQIDTRTRDISHWSMGDLSMQGLGFGISTHQNPPRVLAIAASPTAPVEIYELQKSNPPKALTAVHSWFPSTFDFPPPKDVHFKGPGGQQIHGFMHLPPSFSPEERYPLIAFAHGGPAYSWTRGFTTQRAAFSQADYVVLFLNPRGSTGYGQNFSSALAGNWPGLDSDDIVAGVAHIAATQPYIDSSKLAVVGGSAGGALVDWTITHSTNFSAAVSLSSLANLNYYWYVGDQPVMQFSDPEPWRDPNDTAHSAVNFVSSSTKTPTLFVMGDRDFRTPASIGSLPMFRLLKYFRVPTALVILEGGGHAGRGGDARFSVLFYEYAIKWLDLHLKGKETAEFEILGVS